MATKSNLIVIHTNQGRPSEKAFLVGIPMDMYRLKTQDFSGGLDFFQHAILHFKERPDISNTEIVRYTGFDEKLVELVVDSLKPRYISAGGTITNEGKEALKDPHELITKSEKVNRPGYVFKLTGNNLLLNSYLDEISPVDNYKKEDVLKLVEEDAKGELKKLPVVEIFRNAEQSTTAPTVNEILHRIQVSHCNELDSNDIDVRKKPIAIQFVPDDKPTKVLVCTYVYLPSLDKSTYASDWAVLDPFEKDDEPHQLRNSPQLRFYLESLNDQNFQNALTENFASAPTVEMLSFGQLRHKLEEEIEQEIALLWGGAFTKIDTNLQSYIKIIMQKKREMGYTRFKSREHSQSFISNLQAALECILKIDRQSRSATYKINRSEFEFSSSIKRFSNALRGLCYIDRTTFNNLFYLMMNMIEQDSQPKSLKQYLPEFILSYEHKKDDPLFKLMAQQLKLIIEIAHRRNDHDHGHTEEEGMLTALSREDVNRYYQIFTEIITTLTITK